VQRQLAFEVVQRLGRVAVVERLRARAEAVSDSRRAPPGATQSQRSEPAAASAAPSRETVRGVGGETPGDEGDDRTVAGMEARGDDATTAATEQAAAVAAEHTAATGDRGSMS
jgi:hypothetical protein